MRLDGHALLGTDVRWGAGVGSQVRLTEGPYAIDARVSFDSYFPSAYAYSSISSEFVLAPGRLRGGARFYGGAGVRIAHFAHDIEVTSTERSMLSGEPRLTGLRWVRRSRTEAGTVVLFGIGPFRHGLFAETRFESGGGQQFVVRLGKRF